jgi:hypothetical protein
MSNSLLMNFLQTQNMYSDKIHLSKRNIRSSHVAVTTTVTFTMTMTMTMTITLTVFLDF